MKDASIFRTHLHALGDALLAVCYPLSCAVCAGAVENYANGAACETCWQQTRIFSPADVLCNKCGRPQSALAAAETQSIPHTVNCQRCTTDAFTLARAVGVYEQALRASALKFKREARLPARLAQLLLRTFETTQIKRATCIVPVPLHREKLAERGFNQAALIGESLGRMTGLPIYLDALERTALTVQHRGGMDAKARRATVEKAFTVKQPRLIAGEIVLLTDDVLTTGATASACAQTLLNAGAREVLLLTLARAV